MSIVEPKALTDEQLAAELAANRPLVDDLMQKEARRKRLPKGDERVALWYELHTEMNRNLMRRFAAMEKESNRRLLAAEYQAEKLQVAAFLKDYAEICVKHGMMIGAWLYESRCVVLASNDEVFWECGQLNEAGIDYKKMAM